MVAILERVFRDQWGLVTTARNRAIDRMRRDRTLAAKTRLLDVPETTEDSVDETILPDERLELIFTCCHPTRGEPLRRLGRTHEARDAYDRAPALVRDDAERRLLERGWRSSDADVLGRSATSS